MGPRKKLSDEQLKKREQLAFSRKIRTTFSNAGFTYLPTGGKERKFGLKTGEIDQVFVYDNIILVCEETLHANARDHLKNKKILFEEIGKNKKDFIDWLRGEFVEKFDALPRHGASRYRLFFLYFSKNDLGLTKDDLELFDPVIIVDPSTLGYFSKMASNIRKSIRYDIFRYLGLKSSDIGAADSAGGVTKIQTPIICPEDNTGFGNGVRIVSFMMSAEKLIRNSYVLRKDNWEDSIGLYQRLIEKERIQKIRRYLSNQKSTFINNVIISLPSGVEFRDASNDLIALDDISDFSRHVMHLPDEINSLCVIDGQHRIYAHYEGDDVLEGSVSQLRKKFHLLVTGLIFPPTMTELERRKFESQLFLDINSNSRLVPPDVLLFIETLKDPFSDLGIARKVLKLLNERNPFLNELQLSLMDTGKIKISSIIKFALRYLVALEDSPDRLFHYWETEELRERLLRDKEEKRDVALLDSYVEFCVGVLSRYFGALKAENRSAWDDPGSKIKSTTSINGFIMALRRSLPQYGVMRFEDYRSKFKLLKVKFSAHEFPYTASQYAKFSRSIMDQAFGISSEE